MYDPMQTYYRATHVDDVATDASDDATDYSKSKYAPSV